MHEKCHQKLGNLQNVIGLERGVFPLRACPPVVSVCCRWAIRFSIFQVVTIPSLMPSHTFGEHVFSRHMLTRFRCFTCDVPFASIPLFAASLSNDCPKKCGPRFYLVLLLSLSCTVFVFLSTLFFICELFALNCILFHVVPLLCLCAWVLF